MEWSIDNSGPRYTVNFSEKEGLLSLSKLISNGDEISFPEISLSKISNRGEFL